jgi:serine/threonine-protein kinase
LRFIIEKLLSKRPERRFAEAVELLKALSRECRACEAVQADDAAPRHIFSFQFRVAALMVLVTAIGLAVTIGGVLDRQYQAMSRIALSAGSSIAAFVATNAALPSVENAALPSAERDWLPVQAFIAAAARDESVRWMTMVDGDGVIRGASDPALIGTRYTPPRGEELVYRSDEVSVTDITLADGNKGYRFVNPILYAGRRFGLIEVSLDKSELMAAQHTSRELLLGLGIIVLMIVGGCSYIAAQTIARPLRRFKSALRDATMGDLDFRISHRRKDEIGKLFDAYNLFAATMQERLESAERGPAAPAPDETRIDMAAVNPAPSRGEKAVPKNRERRSA